MIEFSVIYLRVAARTGCFLFFMRIYPVLYALGAMLQGRANFFMDETPKFSNN
jgi:hypothetical protein